MNRLLSSCSAFSKMPYRKVTHVIFDMDGLLLDTENIYTQVTQNVLDKYVNGAVYTFELKCQLMGKQRDEVAKIIVDLFQLPITYDQYVDETCAQLKELMPKAALLPDTEIIYEKIIREMAQVYNKPYPLEVRYKVLGTTEQKTADIAVNELELPITVEEFKKIYAEKGRVMLANAHLMKGAERLVRHLHAHKIPIALATSSGADMVKIKSQLHTDLFELFDHKVCGSTDAEVKHGKPAPDIFLITAKRFPDQPNPANCLVFEDAPNGIQGAVAAGMQAIMVPDPKCPMDQRKFATQVLNSLEEVKLEDFGLPPLKI